jgi:2-(1,2-epoxy-1,2-dihydrophenyl)acetyl-CoA isomerase
MHDSVLLRRDGPVATLTLNRPDTLNVLDETMVDALVAHAKEIAADASLRVVVLAGAGRHFMAGGDIRSFAASLGRAPSARREAFQRMVERLHGAVEHLHRMPHPLVGRVQGAVAGFGLSLMNACDLVVAADDAYFTAAYRHIALSPDGGGTWWLPRLVGQRKAAEIMLLSPRFDAAEALRLGIINQVVPPDKLEAATETVVASLAAAPVTALRNTTRLLRGSSAASLAEQLQAEAVSFGQCTATDDFVEGIQAFLAKRAPRFGRAEGDADLPPEGATRTPPVRT